MAFMDFKNANEKAYLFDSYHGESLKSLQEYAKNFLNVKYRLTNDEYVKLIDDYRSGSETANESLNTIIRGMQSVCFLMAKKCSNYRYVMDFISEANIALMNAINTYNYVEGGSSFIGYAISVIKNYTCQRTDSNVIPVKWRRYTAQIKRFNEKFYQLNGYYPTKEDISDEFPDLQDCDFEMIEHLDKTYISLDTYSEEYDNEYVKNRLEDDINKENYENEEVKLINNLDKDTLLGMINQYFDTKIKEYESKKHEITTRGLVPTIYREKYIIDHMYGLNGCEIMNTTTIANTVGLSLNRVSALAARAIRDMKEYFATEPKFANI